MKKIEIKKLTQEEAINLLSSERYGEYQPLGLFYTIEKNDEGKNIYVGIDNGDGNAWTEDFKNLASCKKWLLTGRNGG